MAHMGCKDHPDLRDKMNKNQTDQMVYVMFNKNIMEVVLILIVSFMAVFLFLSKSKGQALAQLSLYGLISIRFIPAISRIFSSLQLMKTAEGAIELMASEYDFLKNISSGQYRGVSRSKCANMAWQ